MNAFPAHSATAPLTKEIGESVVLQYTARGDGIETAAYEHRFMLSLRVVSRRLSACWQPDRMRRTQFDYLLEDRAAITPTRDAHVHLRAWE